MARARNLEQQALPTGKRAGGDDHGMACTELR